MNWVRLRNPSKDCVAQVGPEDTPLAKAMGNTLARVRPVSLGSAGMLMLGELSS